VIDGQDIRTLLCGQPDAVSPHMVHYCYGPGDELQAVRDRKWKLHFPHRYRTLAGRTGGAGGIPVAYSMATIGLELFDLEQDPGETTNVADRFPGEVARLQALAEQARSDLGDTLTDRTGAAVRPAGRLAPDDARLVW
jgi:arylsulfatase A-like enzyme